MTTEMQAWIQGGFRERYAMEHGQRERKIINGHILWVYRYSKENEYQDANGATYDVSHRKWVN